MTAPDPIMGRISAAQERGIAGDRAGARAGLAALWDEIGESGDALHAVSLAHFIADLQDDPPRRAGVGPARAARRRGADRRASLRANHRHSACAKRRPSAARECGERVRRHHDSLAVRGLFPSLHLNLASDHAKLGNRPAAMEHLAAAEAALPDLPGGGYGAMISGGIARLRAELGPD